MKLAFRKNINRTQISKILVVLFFVLGSLLTVKAQVRIKADTTKIRIGEQIQFQIEVDAVKEVRFHKLVLDSLKKVEIVETLKLDTVKNKLYKKYILTSFDSGRYVLPQQLVNIKNKTYKTDSLFIDVSTVQVDTLKQPLFPIKAIQSQPLDLKDYAKNYWYILPILLLLVFLIWYLFIRKKETEEEKIAKLTPFEQAKLQMDDLDKKLLWQNNKTKQYYTELTDIIRGFIEKELKIPALENTSNEVVRAIKKVNNKNKLEISKKSIIKLKALLQEADLVKFAKFKPLAHEIENHRVDANVILDDLKIEELVEEGEEIIESTLEPHLETNVENSISNNVEEVTVSVTKQKTAYQKMSKKKKRNIIIISIILALCIAGGFFVKNFYDKVMDNVGDLLDTDSTEKIYNAGWMRQSFENGIFEITTPIELKKGANVDLPEEVKKVIVSLDSYQYASLINKLQIASTVSEYVEGLPISLDGAISGALNQLKSNPLVKELEFKVFDVDTNGIPGKNVKGTYKEGNLPTDFEMVIYSIGSKFQMLLIAHKSNDLDGVKIKNKMINSINIVGNDN